MASSSSPDPGLITLLEHAGEDAIIEFREKASLPLLVARPTAESKCEKKAQRVAAGLIEITRQLWVNTVIPITEPYENWLISPDPDQITAYYEPYLDSDVNQMSMSAIIKDAGTGGSCKNPTKVAFLGDIPCQKIAQDCDDMFTCTEVEDDLWQRVKHHEYDFSEFRKMHKRLQGLNREESRSPFAIAAACYAQYCEELKLLLEERYIHYICTVPSEDGDGDVEIIVTMKPRLAKLIHDACSTLHDTTYKWIWGKHNEWEVVIWMKHANAVLGLGDAVMQLNDPAISGFNIREAADIVINILKTCSIHFKRNIQPLALVVSQVDYDKISSVLDITMSEKLNEWHHFCSNHPEKKVHNWYNNNVVHKWYLPSLVGFLSKIPPHDWQTIMGDTNLNESLHPATNHFTDKLDIADENGLSVQVHNTKQEWNSNNVTHANAQMKKNHQKNAAQTALSNISAQIKTLEAEKKQLKKTENVHE
ncbi:hypothetical protein M422DRAFT_266479 [Sphaerobolus stellatus SS14]|uniref:Uncharacterized protein n=1 Tax=Sphaerobolus stellatus (strain SS14) TaxID=990650 RepID=A0A0C9V2J2_SPHS4|nr:hypothetical protein M422DRAFT_266479 [Sphaerobolus stellatus SS14]